MTTGTGSSASRSVAKRLRPELPLIICGKCKQKIMMEYRVKRQGPNKGRVFYKCSDRDMSFLRTEAGAGFGPWVFKIPNGKKKI